MIIEYIFFFKYFIFGLVVVLILFCISFFLIDKIYDIEKLSAYECGFNPFSDSRIKFEIRFYIIGILFIIVDLELLFFIPWLLVVTKGLNIIVRIIMFIFILLLFLGFLYELIKGALDWE